MKSFLKNLLALTGLVSIITVLGSLAYVDKKLHDVSNGYKYGPRTASGVFERAVALLQPFYRCHCRRHASEGVRRGESEV